MKMAHQKRHVRVAVPGDVFSQKADAGSRIENEKGVFFKSNFNAGCVPAVNVGVFTRYGNGTACSPETNIHAIFPFLNFFIETRICYCTGKVKESGDRGS